MEFLIFSFVGLVFSAFFSGVEMAYTSSSKFKLAVYKQTIRTNLNFFTQKFEDRTNFYSTVLIGNNIALIIFSINMSTFLTKYLYSQFEFKSETLFLLIDSAISFNIIILFGEFFPKVIGRLIPNKLFLVSTPLLFIFYILFYPITIFFKKIEEFFSNKIVKLKSISKKEESFSILELKGFLDEIMFDNHEQEIENEKVNMYKKALNFKDIKARECMIPRRDVAAVELKTPKEELINVFKKTKYSRILIYRNSLDDILGYIHFKDMMKNNDKNINQLIFSTPFFPESMKAENILKILISHKKNIGAVVDEYGSLVGIITIEDIIEEIFGNIYDEHDENDDLVIKQTDKKYIISGRAEIDYLNENYNLNLPIQNEKYQTISGFISNKLDFIPEEGFSFEFDDHLFKILKIENGEIKKVELELGN